MRFYNPYTQYIMININRHIKIRIPHIIYSTAIFILLCSSCEGRSGYLNGGQEETVSTLTNVEWVLVSSTDDIFGEQVFSPENSCSYKFNRDLNGWFRFPPSPDGTSDATTYYFQWSFTTENFTVLYITGTAIRQYWLINRMTSSELDVTASTQDPVLYPNTDKTHYKFVARDKI